jgi:hypothetical protein
MFKHTWFKCLLLIYICTNLLSCYDPQKGCLDYDATNFDVSADENCCCEYPQLVLNIAHRYGADGLRLDSAYTNGLGQPFRLHKVLFYLSDIYLTQGGTKYMVEDTLHSHKYLGADSIFTVLRDDIQLVRRDDNPAHSIGIFRAVGTFDSIGFRFGLLPDVDKTAPGSVATIGSPLRPQPEMMYDSLLRRYECMRLVISRDTAEGTPRDTLKFYLSDFDSNQQIIQKSGTFSHESGYNFLLGMQYDYQNWFENVDLTTTLSAIKSSIANNLSNGVVISQ